MTFDLDINSCVILGENHNPSLMSDHFLKKSGIVSGPDEINRAQLFITPALSQIFFTNNTRMTVDPNRVVFEGPAGADPFQKADKYCSALGYIKTSRMGINFHYNILAYDFKKWFDGFSINPKYRMQGVKYLFEHDDNKNICNVTMEFGQDKSSGRINLNYEYDLGNEQVLGEIKMALVKEWELKKGTSEKLIKEWLD